MEIYKRNLPYVLFIALSIKLIVMGSQSLFDVLALLVLGLGLAFFELRVENTKLVELSSKVDDLENKSKLQTEVIQEMSKNMNSIKVASGFKSVNGR